LQIPKESVQFVAGQSSNELQIPKESVQFVAGRFFLFCSIPPMFF
jgi:hypothetical protein